MGDSSYGFGWQYPSLLVSLENSVSHLATNEIDGKLLVHKIRLLTLKPVSST